MITDNLLSDILWNSDYLDLMSLKWFPYVVNRIIYSPFHPNLSLLSSNSDVSVLSELEYRKENDMSLDKTKSELLVRLIEEISDTSGRMKIVRDLMTDGDACIVCQSPDLKGLKNIFDDRVSIKPWSKSLMDNKPDTIIITKKVDPYDFYIINMPTNIKKIIIMADDRIGKLSKALLRPMITQESNAFSLPKLNNQNIPEIVKKIEDGFEPIKINLEIEEANIQYRKKYKQLREEKLNLYNNEEKSDLIDEINEYLLTYQSAIFSTEPDKIMDKEKLFIMPGTFVWLATTASRKEIAIPLNTRIFIRNKHNDKIEEISASDFNNKKHRLILLPAEDIEDYLHQRGQITRTLLNKLSISELLKLEALSFEINSRNTYKWPNMNALIKDATLCTRRLIGASEIIGDYELANLIIHELRMSKIREYEANTLPLRWGEIEDWMELGDVIVPIPSGPERTQAKKSMEIMFKVANKVLLLDDNNNDWFYCWMGVMTLQRTRRRYIKKNFASNQYAFEVISWNKMEIMEGNREYYCPKEICVD